MILSEEAYASARTREQEENRNCPNLVSVSISREIMSNFVFKDPCLVNNALSNRPMENAERESAIRCGDDLSDRN